MLKPHHLGLYLCAVLLGMQACQLGDKSPKLDPETEKLQREVDSLRQIKEALQDELSTVKETERPLPKENKPIPKSNNAADEPQSGLSVVSAKKQFDPNFNPILRIIFRNDTGKSIASASIGVDFSYNSNELAENCHFDQRIALKLAPGASQTLNIPIPAGYDRNCADKAWVVVKAVTFSDGSIE
jgi:hypothetical protein